MPIPDTESECAMPIRSLSSAVKLGTALRYLIDAKAGEPICERGENGHILQNIEKVIELITLYDLKTVVEVKGYEKLVKFLGTLDRNNKEAVLSAEQATSLEAWCREIRRTLFAEAKKRSIYDPGNRPVPDEKHVADKFGAETIARIGTKIAQELLRAETCLFFGVPTAAAFHVLRALEMTLQDFYSVIAPLALAKSNAAKNPGPLTPPKYDSWGKILYFFQHGPNPNRINNFLRFTGIDRTLIDEWDFLVKNYRNPSMHTDQVYLQNEAEDLAARLRISLNLMLKHSDYSAARPLPPTT